MAEGDGSAVARVVVEDCYASVGGERRRCEAPPSGKRFVSANMVRIVETIAGTPV